jgi:hypothetical protein
MSDIHIDDSSTLAIRGENGYDPVHIEIDGKTVEITGSKQGPLYINALQNIAPIAAHIKEVNHIDPLSVESLFVSEVRNIEPLNIAKFNVTNLPLVNLALRQIPAVDLNVRRLPAISVGLHQVFDLPSNYMVRARFLGFEVFRLQLSGRTQIEPRERFRREQERADNRSFPTVAAAGNPAIPSIRKEKDSTYTAPCAGRHHPLAQPPRGSGLRVGHGLYHGAPPRAARGGSSLSSGG